MTETVAIVRPSVTKPVSRPRSRKPATVSASAIALHLVRSRSYIGKLEAEGVIQRQGDGFPLDRSRVAYLRYCGASAGNQREGPRWTSGQRPQIWWSIGFDRLLRGEIAITSHPHSVAIVGLRLFQRSAHSYFARV